MAEDNKQTESKPVKSEPKKIPQMEINAKNEIVTQTKDLPLTIIRDGKEVEEIVTVQKLSTGVRNKIKSECAKTKILGGQQQIIVDDTEVQEKILSKAIIKAPFLTTVSDLKKLPADVTDYLFDEYNEFAEPSEKKNSKSENPSTDTT